MARRHGGALAQTGASSVLASGGHAGRQAGRQAGRVGLAWVHVAVGVCARPSCTRVCLRSTDAPDAARPAPGHDALQHAAVGGRHERSVDEGRLEL